MNIDRIKGQFKSILNIRDGEGRALLWSWFYVFALFLAYYVLRPIREELGVAAGVDNLPWLFSATLVAMILLNPLFGYAASKWTREKFIAIAYRFFMVLLLVFMILLIVSTPMQQIWIGRGFFVFVSVFNLFVVSVFWSLIVDVFNTEQGKRLFGVIAAGATLGGIMGSALTSLLVERIGQNYLLIISIVLIEVAVFSSRRLSRLGRSSTADSENKDQVDQAPGGSTLSGLTHTFRSPYLLGIACFMLFNSVTSTFLYFQQASVAEANFHDRTSRTVFFANIDLWVNAGTLIFQLFFAGRLVKKMGISLVIAALPIISIIGFSTLAIWPSVAVLVFAQVTRRIGNFGLSRPTREVLFISVSREDRYKAKNFIDTVIYRGGDQLGSWAYGGLIALGLTLTGVSIVAIPLSAIWLVLSFWQGSRQQKLQHKLTALPI